MRPGVWIEAFRPAEGAPPMRLWPFMRWSLSGAWGVLWLAAAFSALAGGMEAVTALILKLVVDTVSAASPDSYFQGANLWMLAGAAALIFWLAFVSSSQSVQAIAGLARWGMLASYACAGVGGGAVFAFQIGWRPRA